MSRPLLSLVTCLCLWACRSPAVPWVPRIQPTCVRSTGSLELDRQRAFLAALLALDSKRYVILENEFPNRLVGHFVSSYQPDIHATRWEVQVLKNGKLQVDALPPYDQTHDRVEDWYRRLTTEIQRYQCREIEWLSWYAESHGLLPIGVSTDVVPAARTEDSP